MPSKEFYHKHKERLKKENAAYYQDNKIKVSSRCKEYRLKNKHRYAELSLRRLHKDMKDNPSQLIYRRTKSRAKIKGIEFDLEPQDIIIPEFCPVLGIKLEFGNRMTAPSIDRFDTDKGYVKGNIYIISGRANMIKNCGTLQEHEAIVQWMKDHLTP